MVGCYADSRAFPNGIATDTNLQLVPLGRLPGKQSASDQIRRLLLICIASFCAPLHADLVTLHNGDRISGLILRIKDDKLQIKPAYSKALDVDMGSVSKFQSTSMFRLALGGGVNLSGIPGHGEDGAMAIVDGERSSAFEIADILSMVPPGKDIEWHLHFDMSGGISRGNTDTGNLRWDTDGMLRTSRNVHNVKLSTLLEDRQNDAATPVRQEGMLQYTYGYRHSKLWQTSLNLEGMVEELGTQNSSRFSAGLALDRLISERDARFLSLSLGADYRYEKFPGNTEGGLTPRWSLHLKLKFLEGTIGLRHRHTFWYNLQGENYGVLESDTRMRIYFNSHLYLNLIAEYDYTEQPRLSSNKNDLILTAGIGIRLQ